MLDIFNLLITQSLRLINFIYRLPLIHTTDYTVTLGQAFLAVALIIMVIAIFVKKRGV